MAIFCVLFSPWTVDNNGDPYTILHIHQLVVFTMSMTDIRKLYFVSKKLK